MPELNLQYAQEPPWLRNDAQPSHFLDDVQKGLQINEARQTLPLKLQALEQDSRMKRLKEEEFLRQREQLISAEEGMAELGAKVQPLIAEGKYQKALDMTLSEGARNFLIQKSPAFTHLVNGITGSLQLETARQRAQNVLDVARIRAERSSELHVPSDSQKAHDFANAEQGVIQAQAMLDAAESDDEIALASSELEKAQRLFNAFKTVFPRGNVETENQNKRDLAVYQATSRKLLAELHAFDSNKLEQIQHPEKRDRILKDIVELNRSFSETGKPIPEAEPPQPGPAPTIDKAIILKQAADAIKLGAPRDKVIQRLREKGITEEP